MHVLNRVLHRYDVSAALVVQAVHNACKCGGLARTGGTRYKHQSLLEAAQLKDLFGNVIFYGVGQAKRDDADNGARRATLTEHVGAKTSQPRNGEREVVVVLVVLGKMPEVAMRDVVDLLNEVKCIGRHQAFGVGSILLSAFLISKLQAGHDKDVGGLVVYHVLQDLFELHHPTPTLGPWNRSTACRRWYVLAVQR